MHQWTHDKHSCSFVLLLFIFLFFDKDFSTRFSVARSAFTTAEPPEPFVSLEINVIFLHEIPTGIIGPSVRLFCLFRVFSGLITNISVHSCPFVVTDVLPDTPRFPAAYHHATGRWKRRRGRPFHRLDGHRNQSPCRRPPAPSADPPHNPTV